MTGAKRFLASTFFNWMAISLANGANVGLMRYKELEFGINVKDKSGFEYGKSKEAGKKALVQTIITRMVIPFIVMFGPAGVISVMKAKKLMPKNRVASLLIEGSL